MIKMNWMAVAVLSLFAMAGCGDDGGKGDMYANCTGTTLDACDQIVCPTKQGYDFCVQSTSQEACAPFLTCVSVLSGCICPGGALDQGKVAQCTIDYNTCVQDAM